MGNSLHYKILVCPSEKKGSWGAAGIESPAALPGVLLAGGRRGYRPLR
jgi:hypothetical protein